MKVIVDGKIVNLNKKDFVAQGGEGSIYEKNGTAYKIYSRSEQMIPEGKIQELSVLTMPNIIKPQLLVRSTKDKSIGYTMRYVTDTYALCQLFTKAFKDRNGITPEKSLSLIQRIQETINHIHSKDILIVDLNEMNFLSSGDFGEVFFIDVDSYQTESFSATAIMDSVRDRHNEEFSVGTDWFSFAIISFQLFIGIHPYKGKHPSIKGIDPRMKQNISVFDPDVRMPKACLPISIIPEVYRKWYKAVLEGGKRLPPPSDLQQVIWIPITTEKVTGGDVIVVNGIGEYDGTIIRYAKRDNTEIIITNERIYVNKRCDPDYDNKASVFGFTNKNTPVIAHLEKNSDTIGNLRLFCVQNLVVKPIDVTIDGSQITDYDGRIYIKNGPNIVELHMREGPSGTIIASPRIVANVVEKASTLYDGVLIQDLLGSYFASIFPESGTHYQIKIDELEGYRIIDAKYEGMVLMVVGVKNGRYDRFVLRINKDYNKYDIRKIEDIVFSGLNFVVLDSGLCICINEEEKIEMFSYSKGSQVGKIVEDESIDGDMRLYKDGMRVLFSKDSQLYTMKMK